MTFSRGLSDELVGALRSGPLSPLLATCRRAELDVRVRDEYLNAYRWGGSLMKLSGPASAPTFECHEKYLAGTALEAQLPVRRGEYRAGPVTEAVVECFARDVLAMRTHAERIQGKDSEGELEDRLALHNGAGDAVAVIDRQVTGGGLPGEIDLLAVTAEPEPRLVVVELKRGYSKDIQDAPSQLQGYVEALCDGGGLRAEFAAAYQTVCRNLTALGLDASPPERIRAGMKVVGLLAEEGLKRESDYLRRARVQATELKLVDYRLLRLRGGQLSLPAPEKWDSLPHVD